MRRVLLATFLLVPAGIARAEDFTGFYAGINAGYAKGHDRDRTVSAPGASPSTAMPGASLDLPPSAQDAAAALRRSTSGNAAAEIGR